jgi:hypothetical protein
MQNDSAAGSSTVTLSIRHVPTTARDTLAARAEAKGQSLQEYLLSLLQEHADHPTRAEVLARIRTRKARMKNGGVSAEAALRALEDAAEERDARPGNGR